MTIEINSEEYGILSTGFRRPSKTQLLTQLRIDALGEGIGFGPYADTSSASPLGRFLAVIAERIDEQFQLIESDYYAAYLSTASGASLSAKASEWGIDRLTSAKAKGTIVVYAPVGTSIPLGTEIQATNGQIFLTTEAAVVSARGRVDIEVEAEEAGSSGNVAAASLSTLVSDIQDVESVSNEYDPGTTLHLGQNNQGSIALAKDESKNDYQIVKLSSIEHPHTLDDITVTVKNDVEATPFSAVFYFHVAIYDHATGELLGRTQTKTFELAAGAEEVLRFTNQGIDVHDCSGDYVRIVFVNEATSEAILGLAYDDANQYIDGGLHLNAVEQTDYDAVLSLTSRLPGATSGGSDGESDYALRLRCLSLAATYGDATEEAIRSQIYRCSGVRSVATRQNRMDYIVNGMNPHSIEATVYGGDPDDIAAALLTALPAGCEPLGTSAVTVLDSVGQAHVMRFNKASRVPIYVDVTLTVDGSFSHALGVAEIKNTIIQYIGGEDSLRTFHDGLLPSEDVIYQKLIGLVMAIDGVLDITLTLGIADDPSGIVNLSIDSDEVAETKSSYIDVEVSA